MARTVAFAFVACLFSGLTWAQTSPAVEKELTDVRLQLNDALLKKDRAFIERTLADEYYCIHSNGVAKTKSEEIASWMSQTALTAVKTVDERVHIYGDIGIVTGRTANEGTTDGGSPPASLFTDIFVKRDGHWQLVGCQATRVPAK